MSCQWALSLDTEKPDTAIIVGRRLGSKPEEATRSSKEARRSSKPEDLGARAKPEDLGAGARSGNVGKEGGGAEAGFCGAQCHHVG